LQQRGKKKKNSLTISKKKTLGDQAKVRKKGRYLHPPRRVRSEGGGQGESSGREKKGKAGEEIKLQGEGNQTPTKIREKKRKKSLTKEKGYLIPEIDKEKGPRKERGNHSIFIGEGNLQRRGGIFLPGRV